MSPDRPLITLPELCKLHQRLLIEQTGYTRDDSWRSLMIMTNLALFQASTADDTFYDKLGGNLDRIAEIGCLACFKPDKFGEIVDTVIHKGQSAIKALGESWLVR